MDVVVCVKQVPETSAKKEIGPDLRFNRSQLEHVVNPFDEYAIEEGLRLKEAHGGEVTVLTMAPASAEDDLRKALAMGADHAVLISDDGLDQTDAWGTAHVLAQALKQLPHDIVLTGMESTDARSGLVPAALAEELGLPSLTFAARLDVTDGKACARRQVPGGYLEVEAGLPAVVSVVKAINEPRYPSLRGIMAAKRKEIKRLSLSDLAVSPSQVGAAGAKERVLRVAPRPEKSAGEVVNAPPAEAARRVADFLQERRLI